MSELNPDIEHWGQTPSGAIFSNCQSVQARYVLWRIWNSALPILLFIGVNSSTAERERNDNTIRLLISLATLWGFGGLFAGNLIPIVTPSPKELRKLIGHAKMEDDYYKLLEFNDAWLRAMTERSVKTLVGWGDQGARYPERIRGVLKIVSRPDVYCIKVNPSGEPVHPLYQPLTSKLIPYIRR